jgi:UTP-glucose-1-phosphate uridylyltransferase/transcriptional regulator with XRE-family HTH domain
MAMEGTGANAFGQQLREAREAAGLSRQALADRVMLDVSHIYRMETGGRRPSRETALALAEAVGVDDEATNRLLLAAGYAPMPFLPAVRTAVRTRGGGRRPKAGALPTSDWQAAHWARWLDAMGLQDPAIGQLLRAMDSAPLVERQAAARAMREVLAGLTRSLQSPVRKAVIPAAGGQHRILAAHVMQSLLIGAIREAAEAGIVEVLLVLPPGAAEALYRPLKEALDTATVPLIRLDYVEQPSSAGLGDAILQARGFVGDQPFAVLLPDDVFRARAGRSAEPRELRRMLDAFVQLGGANLVAVTPINKTRMYSSGVARIRPVEKAPKSFPILELAEKPEAHRPIVDAEHVFGIVGRYLLQPAVFGPLGEFKRQKRARIELTDALELLRQREDNVYAFELEAKRQDLGQAIGEAAALLGPGGRAAPRGAHPRQGSEGQQ